MKHCLNCGAEFEGKFCPNCGAAWQEEKKCPQCGATLAGNVKFCNECGYSFIPNTRPPQNVEPQRSVPQPTLENRPKSVNSRGMSAIYALSRYLPAALLGLFAVLFFLFYLAPAAVMPGGNFMGESIPGTSYGSLYEILSVEELASLSDCAGALIAFAVILAVFACVAVPVYCNPSGRLKSCVIVTVIVCVLDFVLLLVGSILIGKIGEFDGGLGLMKAGAAPILTVVFSCILLVFTIAAVGVRAYFETKCPEFMEAYNAAQEARMASYRATHAKPVPPEKIAAPKHPKKSEMRAMMDAITPERKEELRGDYEAFIRKKSAYATIYPLVISVLGFVAFLIMVIIFAVMLIEDGSSNPSESHIMEFIPCFILLGIGVVLFSILHVWAKKRRVKGWDPKKVYRGGCVTVSTVLTTLFLFIFVLCAVMIGNPESIANGSFWEDYFITVPILSIVLPGIAFIAFIIVLPVFCKLNRKRKPLVNKMCDTLMTKYEQECTRYKENRRAWKVYRYQLRRYERGKDF